MSLSRALRVVATLVVRARSHRAPIPLVLFAAPIRSLHRPLRGDYQAIARGRIRSLGWTRFREKWRPSRRSQ